MKNILFILLLIPLALSAQTPVGSENKQIFRDTVVAPFVRLTGDTTDLPSNAAMPKQQVIDNINARMGGGGTVYASDGVYMDGDTVKLSNNIAIPEDSSFYIIKYSDSQYSSVGVDANESDTYGEIETASTLTNLSSGIKVYGDRVLLNHTSNDGSTATSLSSDITGVYYITQPDTTQTTPTHLMTEQQVKREIAAVQSYDSYNSLKYGKYSLSINSGIQNYAFGSLNSNTTGTYNNGFGYVSLDENTSGSENSAFGTSALRFNETGSQNSAFGSISLQDNVSGTGNTAIGYSALPNSLGNYNIAIGYYAGRAQTSLSNRLYINSILRSSSLASDTTSSIIYGYQNSAVANQRLYFNVGRATISGQLKTLQISAALTDNTPTDAEIDTATGLTPITAGAGYQVTIKDNNGTGLLYKVESDGTDWYYIVMTKAL